MGEVVIDEFSDTGSIPVASRYWNLIDMCWCFQCFKIGLIVMTDWEIVRPIVEDVLKNQRVKNRNYDETCFLTAYQIAVLVDKQDPNLKGALSIGGEGEGGVNKSSFAHKIAWHLSKAVNENYYGGNLERKFFSIDGLDSFAFGGMKTPSVNKFLMFRMIEPNSKCNESLFFNFDGFDLSFHNFDLPFDVVDLKFEI